MKTFASKFIARMRLISHHIWYGYDASISIQTPVYTVDITNPPIVPPNVTMIECALPIVGSLGRETDLSKRSHDAWGEYIKEYGRKIKLAKGE